MNHGLSVELLLGMNDRDLTRLMTRFHSTEEEVQKLRSALANLKRWTGEWRSGDGVGGNYDIMWWDEKLMRTDGGVQIN